MSVPKTISDRLPNIDLDYHSIDIVHQNSIRYVCGYYINKCLQVHTCDICEHFSSSVHTLDDTAYYCFFRAYKNKNMDTYGNLKMPDNSFITYVFALEQIFHANFEEIIVGKTVLYNFIDSYDKVEFTYPCQNFSYKYFLKLYSTVRLFFTPKFVNRNCKSLVFPFAN